MSKSRDTYWAALPDSAEVAREVLERRKTYRAWLESTGATRRGISGLRAYYGWGPQGLGDTSQLGPAGMTGEYNEQAAPEFAGAGEQAARFVEPRVADHLAHAVVEVLIHEAPVRFRIPLELGLRGTGDALRAALWRVRDHAAVVDGELRAMV